jgi:hypothetical protein
MNGFGEIDYLARTLIEPAKLNPAIEVEASQRLLSRPVLVFQSISDLRSQ